MALEFRPPEAAARLFDEDKYKELMIGDVGQAQSKLGHQLMFQRLGTITPKPTPMFTIQ